MDSLERFRKAIRWCVRRDAVRASIFPIVRRVRLKERRVFNWMKIFDVREFFEGEIRDPLSHDDVQKLPKARRRLKRRLKPDQREWLRVLRFEKNAGRHVESDLWCLKEMTGANGTVGK